MIEFLNECNISEDTIKKLETIYPEETLYNLYCNEYQIKDIIGFFNSIGLTCIDDILINYTGMFLNTFDEIKEKFEGRNLSALAKAINEDFTIMGEL